MNVAQDVVGFDGKPIKQDGAPLKIRTVLLRALGSALPGDEQLPVEKVMERYALAMKVQSGEGVVKFSPEELVELRARVAKVWALEVAGAVIKLLEG